MGCGQSSDRQGEAVSRNIEEQLKKDREVYKNELKLLILGCGESGKSTIVKQMTLIHGKGYTDEQKLSFKECIFSNTIVSIQVILQAMEILEIVLNDDANAVHRDVILNFDQVLDCDCLPPEVIKAIQELWKDSGVQHCYSRSREYQLNDSAEYLFNSVERFAKADYIPTDQDILRARMKTLGVQESLFQVGKVTYRMVDVGGQRSERKKWIHCFENVSAVIFMSAISEFDQTLQEDTPVNRMTEAYTLFDSICNLRWFANVSSILFLNKTDLLKKKLEKTQLKDWCPDYEGDNSYDSAAEYFKGKFIALNRNQAKHVYVHFTCATDTTQVKFVMSAVNDIIVKANLKDCGLV